MTILASIIALFVFYNIVTVHTDLIHCGKHCLMAFVLTNAPAFGFAIISQTTAAAVRFVFRLLPHSARDDFALAVVPVVQLSGVTYGISLVFFIMCFGIYGYAKLVPHQISTFVLAGSALLCMGFGTRKLHNAFKAGQVASTHKLDPLHENPGSFKLWWCATSQTWHEDVQHYDTFRVCTLAH